MLGFIVDFYCVEQRLVVEVDGGIHETQTDRDTARDQLMHAHGHRVLRLSEDEAVNHTDVAVARIRTALSG